MECRYAKACAPAACAQAYTRGDGTRDMDVSGDQEQL